ncbi:hypothetical protein [Rhodovulum sp. P5]|uniref:hypothetical protein n=1 Tax=Rhodovulum sp. P5 TaxID=1564506 RepID=UPI0012EC967E|nr:hypothetical protein [Rhodovulum sp. P5]
MGIIDSTYFRIRCPQCGTVNIAETHQRGSNWSPGSWGSISGGGDFSLSVKDDDVSGPDIVSATCKQCGEAAEVELHGFAKPKDW